MRRGTVTVQLSPITIAALKASAAELSKKQVGEVSISAFIRTCIQDGITKYCPDIAKRLDEK